MGASAEVMTVSECEAVIFEAGRSRVVEDLTPDTVYHDGTTSWRTLARPPGERLATVATVNDTHFGEEECGIAEINIGPVLSVAPGEEPYPQVMNQAAAAEIAALDPDVVVAKGDITATAEPAQFALFEQCYGSVLGDRVVATLGNHDNQEGRVAFAAPAVREVVLPGVLLAVLDTTTAEGGGGRLSPEQVNWLDELGARADRSVLVFGHHPVRQVGAFRWSSKPNALDEASSDLLLAVLGRRRAIAGYFCGHTHRNAVERFEAAAGAVHVEVACVKDFPGSWAEYRVFEGGILQVHHRIRSPEALAWSERCRAMFGGRYPEYALGTIADRCFVLPDRRAALGSGA